MKKTIITIERQYGSGGSHIGKLTAEKLGINCYNRQILEMTAQRCGIAPEYLESAEENVPTSFLYSLLLSANPARTMEENLPLSDKVFLMESRIINEIADNEKSFVLVGRCGSYILEEKGCFSVYIYADPEYRIKRAIEQYDINENKAESVMKKADKRRETFYNVNTGRVWQDKDQYALCLNSAQLGDELCAEMIVKAYNEYNKRFSE
ncbi:AAA family ATPase [Ruminococcus sp.]|uniref:cytidylate kinase-like family protein n=1 Tax=Ruminococcus sp. TaxID=41978 RepID=UPI0025EE8ED7|nr:cytidylate kinase-like family protein [Ruminococcus sp.]MBQ6252914.1 cytidylate kinase-like family protein [Ruminococcus sp.]MBR3666111.1 cytidylate kinase-like family protein [Ruminococcus sp.]MBR6996544.1 cytidylate kinase-like family protein [Ruminococcus sp.]